MQAERRLNGVNDVKKLTSQIFRGKILQKKRREEWKKERKRQATDGNRNV
jgi:hypothetical protein